MTTSFGPRAPQFYAIRQRRRNAIVRSFVLFGLLLALSLFVSQKAQAASSKPEILRNLGEWRTRIVDQDERTSSAQKKIISSLAANGKVSELDAPLNEIAKHDDDRSELEARRRIVDQIIFSVDTKWNGSNLRGFLEGQLLDLAVTDLSEARQGGWWRFLIQAAVSLKETAEPGADPVKFLEAYMAESGVLEPKPAADVLKTRNYIRD